MHWYHRRSPLEPALQLNTRFIDQWIQSLLRERPVRANSLIITVYGDSIAPHGGTVWLGSFIRLVEPLGLNARLVRTSVFRLTREKWLVAERAGRRSYYSLTPTGRRRFEHAYRRIYNEPPEDWSGEWQIVLFPTGALPQPQREQVRKELLWEGFGVIAPGVLAHPSADLDGLMDILDGSGVRDRVVVMQARGLGAPGGRSFRHLVRDCWDLTNIGRDYGSFIERFQPLALALQQARDLDPQQCFVAQTLLLHEFRRVLLRDPQLPTQLLPEDWPGSSARALCRDIYLITQRHAQRHLMSVLESPSGRLPQAAPYYYERFGGLESTRDASEAMV